MLAKILIILSYLSNTISNFDMELKDQKALPNGAPFGKDFAIAEIIMVPPISSDTRYIFNFLEGNALLNSGDIYSVNFSCKNI